jgi:hypothetical protein
MLEVAVEERVPLKKFRLLEQKVRTYTAIEMFDAFVSKVEKDQADLYQRFEPLVTSLQVDSKMAEVKQSLDAHFRGFSVKRDCIQDKKELKHEIANLNKSSNDIFSDL